MTKTQIKESNLYAYLCWKLGDTVEAFEVIECMRASVSEGEQILYVLADNELPSDFADDLLNMT